MVLESGVAGTRCALRLDRRPPQLVSTLDSRLSAGRCRLFFDSHFSIHHHPRKPCINIIPSKKVRPPIPTPSMRGVIRPFLPTSHLYSIFCSIYPSPISLPRLQLCLNSSRFVYSPIVSHFSSSLPPHGHLLLIDAPSSSYPSSCQLGSLPAYLQAALRIIGYTRFPFR